MRASPRLSLKPMLPAVPLVFINAGCCSVKRRMCQHLSGVVKAEMWWAEPVGGLRTLCAFGAGRLRRAKAQCVCKCVALRGVVCRKCGYRDAWRGWKNTQPSC